MKQLQRFWRRKATVKALLHSFIIIFIAIIGLSFFLSFSFFLLSFFFLSFVLSFSFFFFLFFSFFLFHSRPLPRRRRRLWTCSPNECLDTHCKADSASTWSCCAFNSRSPRLMSGASRICASAAASSRRLSSQKWLCSDSALFRKKEEEKRME